MFSIETFSLQEMTELSSELRKLGAGARTQEEIADRIVNSLYEGFTVGNGEEKAFVLVRFFVSLHYKDLESPLKRFL